MDRFTLYRAGRSDFITAALAATHAAQAAPGQMRSPRRLSGRDCTTTLQHFGPQAAVAGMFTSRPWAGSYLNIRSSQPVPPARRRFAMPYTQASIHREARIVF